MSNNRKPDYIIGALNKTNSSKCRVGAAWTNSDGTISISINPCVTLVQDDNITLRLFPADYKKPLTTKTASEQYKSVGAKDDALKSDDDDVPF